MSTFYDNVESNTDVIFVANNMGTIRKMSNLFPKVSKFWFFPRKAFTPSPGMWEIIVRHQLCIGTGVTPKNFDYVGDWIECGKTNVFDYYGVKRHPLWAKSNSQFKFNSDYTVIQPFGGADDPTKTKMIPDEAVEKLWYDSEKHGCFLIGSKNDANRLPQYAWVTDIEEAFNLILGCHTFYGADSWGKTVACFAKKETYVYPNVYDRDPHKLFNHNIDPGDYVFLNGWDLTRIDVNDE